MKRYSELKNSPDKNDSIDYLVTLSEEEKEQLLYTFNSTEKTYEKNVYIHTLFEEQVLKTPNEIAIVYQEESLTYDELNCRANQLAHYLTGQGFGPGKLVGIAVERSLEMAIGIIGILKSGAAYVPIDPYYPMDRIEYMLADGKVQLLLTQERLLGQMVSSSTKILCLDRDWANISKEPDGNLLSLKSSDNLAYIIYTSGSTGTPKGVCVEHRSVCNTLLWRREEYKLSSDDVVLQLSSFSFDSFVTNFFTPLFSGGRVVFVTETEARDPISICKIISQYKVTHFTCVPVLYSALLEILTKETSQSLRIITLAGESVTKNVIQRSKDLNPAIELVNEYGPTECSVATTVKRNMLPNEPVTIGRPISNAQVYIMKNEQLQPIGVAGELYIGGAGITRGYLNQPDLTNEKFVTNPFNPAQLLYRSGDLARWLPNGTIEYLGRIDNQVKIRGYRIELGEIEEVLTNHSDVKNAIVIAQEDENGETFLAAYIVTDNNKVIDKGEFKKFISKKLPSYMVPKAIVPLESIPLTPNGKIDRKALARPTNDHFFSNVYIAPKKALEEIVIDIWGSVLNILGIGTQDNFFEVGGNSILATQVISRLNRDFQLEMNVNCLFEYPTVSSLVNYIEKLQYGEKKLPRTIKEVTLADKGILSSSQQRLWILDQLLPNGEVYNVPSALNIEGILNIELLEKSLREIVMRHGSLRTTFELKNNQPMQRIYSIDHNDAILSVINMFDLDMSTFELETKKIMREDTLKPFDLTKDRLFRFTLFRHNNKKSILFINMHHIVTDAWSHKIILEECFTLYEAFLCDQASQLENLSIQYTDFAYWQREWLEGEIVEEQLKYWKEQLSGAPNMLELPIDYSRSPVQTYRGASERFVLSNELKNQLKLLGQKHGATLFMTLLAAYQTLIYRITGQDDICIGTPIAGRNHSELENLVGFFVNTLVIRTPLDSSASFVELLRKVREVSLGAYAHQDLPFDRLVEEMGFERNSSHSPLFQTMFILQNALTPVLPTSINLMITPIQLTTDRTKFDLTLEMEERDEGIYGSIEYNVDLFKPSTIQRLISHFKVLLQNIVSQPENSIDNLVILSEEEKEQLLYTFNSTEQNYEKNVHIQTLFEEQVLKTPNEIAIVYQEESLTYDELNRRANQLAHYLTGQGLGPGKLVGIAVERSLEMAIGIIGILKSGAAYVPIDPHYPMDRIEYMLADGKVQLLLIQEHLLGQMASSSTKILCLDRDWANISKEPDGNLLSLKPSDNLAYIIYTSGSTGKPKGVCVEHRSVCNTLLWRREEYKLSSDDVVLQLSSFSFDSFVTNFFTPLFSGGRVVFVTETEARDPISICKIISQYKVTHFTCVPVLYSALLEILTKETSQSLRIITLAGESVTKNVIQRSKDLNPAIELVNEYGPTECSVATTVKRNMLPNQPVTIGRPISNAQVYIMKNEQLQPIGVAGELYIGGAGVTRGYLNQPDLTNEKFVTNPFNPAQLLYRSGDLARWLPNGTIEYLGRIDNQVKIRGYRIELGEIEEVLNNHSAIAEAVVLIQNNEFLEKRIIAFLIGSNNSKIDVLDVKRYVSKHLPTFMVPNYFVQMDNIPKTPNGKIDKKTLARYSIEENIQQEQRYKGPRDHVELNLTHMWEDILNFSPISINANFFELGGHSLLLVRLVEKIREKYQVDIPLQNLLNDPTIEELAFYIRNIIGNSDLIKQSCLVPLKSGNTIPIYLVHFPNGFLWGYSELIRCLDENRTVYGFQMSVDKENQSLEEIAREYTQELISFQSTGPYILAGFSSGGHLAVEMGRQLQELGLEVAFVGLFDTFVVDSVEEVDEFELFLSYANRYHPSPQVIEELRNLDFEGRLQIIYKMELGRGMVVPDFSIERQRIFVRTYLSFLKAILTNKPKVYDGHVTLFKALDMEKDSRIGWEQLLKRGLGVEFVPGDHINLMRMPNVKILAEKLQKSIDLQLEMKDR